jgi:hypothetical protein
MANRRHDEEEDQQETRTRALIGLAIVLALAIIAIVLVRELRTESQREDCLMAGRSNCAQITVPPRQ